MGAFKTIKTHSCMMTWGGYDVIVDNNLYMLAIDTTKKFLTMQGVIDEIKRRETGIAQLKTFNGTT